MNALRQSRILPESAELVTDGLRITVEAVDRASVERMMRRIRSVMAEHRAADELHALALARGHRAPVSS